MVTVLEVRIFASYDLMVIRIRFTGIGLTTVNIEERKWKTFAFVLRFRIHEITNFFS